MSIGFDNDPLNFQLLLSLLFREMVGVVAHDRAKPSVGAGAVQELPHTCILNGGPPAWVVLGNGLAVLDFNLANPDFLDCPVAATNDLDFTTEDFSCAVWINIDTLADSRALIVRGLANTDGWYLWVGLNGELSFMTNQTPPAVQNTYSAVGEITTNNWWLVGATRADAVVRVYKNGVDISDTIGAHVAPTTSPRELHIGVLDDEASYPYDGRMWNPRIWARRLGATEMMRLFTQERHLFGI